MYKKYDGRKMLFKSRFVKYLSNINGQDIKTIEKKINYYINDNEEFCDKGNYRHLSNIFTCMALFDFLVERGQSETEAENLIFDTMYSYMQVKREKFQKLAKYGWFWPLIKKLVPFGFRVGSGTGWAYTWHKDLPKNEFRFECKKCIYKPIFSKYGFDRFGPKFCYNDIIVYGELPRTDFIRTKTISKGDEMCDFKFIHYNKNEKFKRTKSV